MAWATITDVDDLTGATVTAEEIAIAQAIIEIHVARTEDVPADMMSARDLRWLTRAVAYQTVWVKANPDLFTRIDHVTILQDGVEVRDLPPDALTLAPLAKKAIRRLSWMKSRSIHTPSHFETAASVYPIGGDVKDYPGEGWSDL
jgi:hypothetical protein